jgi:hypothetical protein
LVEAVVDLHGGVVAARMRELAEQPVGTRRPSVDDLVRVLTTPFVELFGREPDRGADWLGVIAQLPDGSDWVAGRNGGQDGDTFVAVRGLARKVAPTVSNEGLATCCSVAAAALVLTLARSPNFRRPRADRAGSWTSDLPLVLTAFVVGGLENALGSAVDQA